MFNVSLKWWHKWARNVDRLIEWTRRWALRLFVLCTVFSIIRKVPMTDLIPKTRLADVRYANTGKIGLGIGSVIACEEFGKSIIGETGSHAF